MFSDAVRRRAADLQLELTRATAGRETDRRAAHLERVRQREHPLRVHLAVGDRGRMDVVPERACACRLPSRVRALMSSQDCAKYLNGRGKGARYDGTFPGSPKVGSCASLTTNASKFSSSYKTLLRKMWEAQVTTFEKNALGWVYCARLPRPLVRMTDSVRAGTWKTEQAPEWSYSAGLANGWIPVNPTDRTYPNICG